MKTLLGSVCLALLIAASSAAAPLLSVDDFIIGIDLDTELVSLSGYPEGEAPGNAIDEDQNSKYLNTAGANTGFIVSPFFSSTDPATVQAIQFRTANDSPGRDPASWELYGTNDPIMSVDNGQGDQENWTLIAGGDLTLPEERFTLGGLIPFANTDAYSSFKVGFPTLKQEGSLMQIADVFLHEESDGSDFSIWFTGDPTLAFHDGAPQSRSPAGQGAPNLLDGTETILIANSSSPANEQAPLAIDDVVTTKYLNFGEENSGFIVTPAGASQVQSFQLTTANDAVERDPASWQLFGTNDPIASTDHSTGLAEAWTLIDSGDIELPAERDTLGPVVPVTNSESYASYKLLFPTVKDEAAANSMQLAEASFFESNDGSGADVTMPGDAILAIQVTETTGQATKYLNFGKENSGFIVTPSAGTTVVNEFQITTANDAPERDPVSWELWGTNDAITSEENSAGDGENWVMIDSGSLDDAEVPMDRETAGANVAIDNDTAFKSYRMVFPQLRDAELANSLQIANIDFFGDVIAGLDNADFDGNGVVDGADLIAHYQRGFGLTDQTDNSNGDANGDGTVDGADQAIWDSQFGGAPSSAASAAIPEPASAALALLAVCASATFVGRRHWMR